MFRALIKLKNSPKDQEMDLDLWMKFYYIVTTAMFRSLSGHLQGVRTEYKYNYNVPKSLHI
jgi:hypothetical protein